MSHARAMLKPCLTPFSFSFNGGFSFSSTLRRAVLPTDMTSSSVLNSQFFVSIFNLTQKLALVTPFGRISSW
ncbi:hypothetical protein LCGC14_1343770 [marine sediment metagenome]|uniref:Uncharacterized protein n=1 Tax=marine sediment metagenome TaxID=412755 RepID=A0A0F9NFB3_9ZZZZ